MNNELKQLCEQAKAYATESTKHFTGDEPVVWMDYYTEKFAELIVLECVQVVNAADESCEDYYGPIIKEHFGVEE